MSEEQTPNKKNIEAFDAYLNANLGRNFRVEKMLRHDGRESTFVPVGSVFYGPAAVATDPDRGLSSLMVNTRYSDDFLMTSYLVDANQETGEQWVLRTRNSYYIVETLPEKKGN